MSRGTYSHSGTRGGQTTNHSRKAYSFKEDDFVGKIIRKIEKRIAKYQAEMDAEESSVNKPAYQKLITNERRALDYYKSLKAA